MQPLIDETTQIIDVNAREDRQKWILTTFSKIKTLNISKDEFQINLPLLLALYDYRNSQDRFNFTNILLSLYENGAKNELDKWKAVATSLNNGNLSKKKQKLVYSRLTFPPSSFINSVK